MLSRGPPQLNSEISRNVALEDGLLNRRVRRWLSAMSNSQFTAVYVISNKGTFRVVYYESGGVCSSFYA